MKPINIRAAKITETVLLISTQTENHFIEVRYDTTWKKS